MNFLNENKLNAEQELYKITFLLKKINLDLNKKIEINKNSKDLH